MALTRRWANQDAYDWTIYSAASRHGVPAALVKAVIAAESAFNPRARRAEAPRSSLPPTPDHPQGGDESLGLMQLLVRTARGLGYTGTKDGLFDPAINVNLGVSLLRDLLRSRQGVVADAVSAYNGGYRPTLGFGAVGASGRYGNQEYVDRVIGYQAYFEQWARSGGAGTPTPFPGGGEPGEPGPGVPGPAAPGPPPVDATPVGMFATLWRMLRRWVR